MPKLTEGFDAGELEVVVGTGDNPLVLNTQPNVRTYEATPQ